MRNDSVVALDTGATANLACFKWLGHHNSNLQTTGFPKVTTYPTIARFEFGYGRVGEVKYAADFEVGVAGRRGAFASFVSETDIPALLRRGSPEALGGQQDADRDI